MSKLVTILPGGKEHYNLIKATWLKSFYFNGSRFCECLSFDVYSKYHVGVIERLLAKSQILVAQSISSPDVTVAYIVYEPNTLHFMYTKFPLRNFGIAKELFQASGLKADCQYTHRTGDSLWIHGFYKRERNEEGIKKQVFIQGLMPKLIYNPYGAFL